MTVAPMRIPLVLVHGWAGSAEIWAPVTALLDAEGWGPVHCVRLPGSRGGSGRVEATVGAAARELARELSELSIPALVVGHSMGAQITMLAHGMVPGAVLGEVVVDPAYGGDPADRDEMAAWAARIDREGHAALDDFFDSPAPGLPEPARRRILTDLHDTPASVVASYLRSEYVDADAVGLQPATGLASAGRRHPVLALHSTPAGAERERALPLPPGSRIELWSGRGHFLHLEEPERFVTLLQRWRERLGAASSVAGSTVPRIPA